MIEIYKQAVLNQYDAAFCTLSHCIEQCPDKLWEATIANLTFNQVAFHVLFYADVYLGKDLLSLREQPFHTEYTSVFSDYEELVDKTQEASYDKPFINAYLKHCRDKAPLSIAIETEETLARCPGFDWLKLSRAEVHAYNLRHLQHHAAQLSLRLRLDAGKGIPWFGSGWHDE